MNFLCAVPFATWLMASCVQPSTQAVGYVEPATGNMLLVTSWNEWHEDTQIEPVVEAPPTDVDDGGGAYSEGLYYEGYGERYLQILQEETTR